MCLLVLPSAGLDESGAPAQEQADEDAQTQTKFGLLSLEGLQRVYNQGRCQIQLPVVEPDALIPSGPPS